MKSKNNFSSKKGLLKIVSSFFIITILSGSDVHAQRNLFDNFEQRSKAIGIFTHSSNTTGAYRSGFIPANPCFTCDIDSKHAGGFFTSEQWKRFANTVNDRDEEDNEHLIEVLQQTVLQLSRKIESLTEEMDHIRSVLIIDSKLTSKQTFLVQ